MTLSPENPTLVEEAPFEAASNGNGSGAEPQAWTGITAPSARGRSVRRIGEVIVDLGYAPAEVVEKAVTEARESGQPTGKVLVETGVLTPDQLARAVAERYGLDHLDLRIFRVDMGALNLVSSTAARRYEAIPVAFSDDNTLLVAMADPANVLAVDDIAMMTGYEVRRAVTSRDDIDSLIAQINRLDTAVEEAAEEIAEPLDLGHLRESAEDAPIVKLVYSIIADAVTQGASDIHFDPEGKDMRVRFRVDGLVSDSTTVPRSMVAGVVSRIKIMAELNISETRRPQDGRVSLLVEGRQVDIRVVTLPIVRGESVVMRILDRSSVVMELESLGMADQERAAFAAAIKRAHGSVLVTGPTGSGKTTTLYAALTEVNTPDKTMITIEDPVEYQLDGIKQVQVNQKVGLNFASGLRSMLRADPNVIMVGEVRDRETAQIAVEAALTGHLVLTTLHTNDAPAAITRLIEMGIEPFLVASALDCVVAQRLARTLCECRQPVELSAASLKEAGFKATKKISAYEPGGCNRCSGSGYKGRIGLYEVMPVTREIRQLVLERRSADEIADLAREQGMRTLRDDGLDKVQAGVTSISEVSRVTAGWAD